MTPPLMLFAAGFGTRMGPLTRDLPKPLIEVAGRPLIDHALRLADGAGIDRRVANTHYRPEALEAWLSARGVTALRETPEILDTGGGLKNALPALGGDPVLTLNTDAVWTGPNPLARLARGWRDGMGALLLVVPLARATGRKAPGDFAMDTGERLRRGGDLVYTGAGMIEAGAVAARPGRIFGLGDVWDALAAEGRLFGLVHTGGWADVGHPGGIAAAEAMVAADV